MGAELFATAADGRSPYDGVQLSSGVRGGGTQSHDFRLDLGVIYPHPCGNHPRADEAAYPLWMDLPASGARARALAAAPPELGRLNWATRHFQGIVQQRTGGLNPFGNRGVRYTGSADDEALNRSVPRHAAAPQATARFAADTDPGGRIPVTVLTVHAIDDPVAFVELESVFHDTMARAGSAGHLVQTFTDDHEHSYLSDAAYATLMAALLSWLDGGPAPTPASIAQGCAAQVAAFGTGCRFLPDYRPPALAARLPARLRP